jgi:signal transduction histidine kinase
MEELGSPTDVRARQLPRWVLVLGFWALIVLLYSTRNEVRGGPYVWVPISRLEGFKFALAQWGPWGLLSICIYWVNRLLPVSRDALMPRLLLHVPLGVVFTIAYTYLNYGMTRLLDAPTDAAWVVGDLFETAVRVSYRLGMFVYWAIASVCVALDYQADLKDRQIRNAELERLLSEARLATLRTQLHPHFLFNTLNTISAHVEHDPRAARLMIEQLGDLLRLSLEHAEEPEVPLARELAFVDRYLQLQLARFGDRLKVDVQVDPQVLDAMVPTFILQPLVENAITHGTSKLVKQGQIELAALREGKRLRVRVRDNGAGLPRGWTIERSKGIGIANTRERLTHLYGSDHDLSVTPAPAGGVQVDLSLPLRAA